MSISLVVDIAEPRVRRDRLAQLVYGDEWDQLAGTFDGLVEQVTNTAMLTPLYLTPEWATSVTGSYARLSKASYRFDTSSGGVGNADKWVEHHYPYQGNIYLQSQGVNERAITTAKYPKNRGFLLSWFAYNAGQESREQIECGWEAEGGKVGVSVWTDGKCYIYKNGVLVGRGNIFERQVTSQGGHKSLRSGKHVSSKGAARQLAGQTVDLLLIPYKRRQLLLLSNQGGGFTHVFEDLDPADSDSEITPNQSSFYWYVGSGQATVLCAPLRFKTSGTLLSRKLVYRQAPEIGEEPAMLVYWDEPGYGSGGVAGSLVVPDNSGAFVPDGHLKECRFKLGMTGDGESSPFVYSASGTFDPIYEATDASEAFDISAYATEISLSVPESASGARLTVVLHSPNAVDSSVAGVSVIENRPVQMEVDGATAFLGRGMPPKSHWGTVDRAGRLTLEFEDYVKALRDYRIQDAIPVDGLDLGEGLRHFARLAGMPNGALDIPDFGFKLPTVGHRTHTEFALMPDVGDTALEWFERLMKEFASHCEWYVRPAAGGIALRVAALDDLNAGASVRTLFATKADAISAGVSLADVPYRVFRSLDKQVIRCEANDIWVTGRDHQTGKQFQCHFADKDSMDPSIAPSARPLNWVGEPRRYAWVSPAITTVEAGNWACATLARRLVPYREIYEVEAEFQIVANVPVWRGDCVTLDGIGKCRVVSLKMDTKHDTAGHVWRPTKYVMERVF